jgi:hypothetical protein
MSRFRFHCRIAETGGRILGVVFNQHQPNWPLLLTAESLRAE